jgi:hypothetical protein
MAAKASTNSFRVGQLIDFQWKLGVSVKSSDCNNLGNPFVAVKIRVMSDNGKVEPHTFELSLPEFHVFVIFQML